MLIDVAIPVDKNVVQKEAEKRIKCKSLYIEIKRMWNLKCTVVPVIIGATGWEAKCSRKNLEAIPGKHSTDSLQKTAILGTSHTVRKVLQSGKWSRSGGDQRWFKRSTGEKRAVTRDNSNNNNNNIIIIIIISWMRQFGLFRLQYQNSSLHGVLGPSIFLVPSG